MSVNVKTFLTSLLSRRYLFGWQNFVEIIILTFLIYHAIIWIRNTRAFALLKGVLVIAVMYVVSVILGMNTISWIIEKLFSIAVMALIIILQPELRKAMEELGRLGNKNFFASLIPFIDSDKRKEEGRFSDRTINEIVRACVDMGKVKTGALIVIEQEQSLNEIERTGIDIDALVSNQLLINIFEKNTPLHDGAVIIRGNRVVSATCYLPLSDNSRLSKDLGTRHRAGVGVSETTDSMTIIVSEETGKISVAYKGNLYRNLDNEGLKEKLRIVQNKNDEGPDKKKHFIKKGRVKNEK